MKEAVKSGGSKAAITSQALAHSHESRPSGLFQTGLLVGRSTQQSTVIIEL